MSQRKIPARDLIVQVSDGATTPTWITIAGLTSIVVNNGENEETANLTDNDSAGNHESWVMQRGKALTLQGHMKKDHLTGAQDSGQARCETVAEGVAYESLGSVRFRHPMDTEWRVWGEATFHNGDAGGPTNDPTSWNMTIRRSGATTTAAV